MCVNTARGYLKAYRILRKLKKETMFYLQKLRSYEFLKLSVFHCFTKKMKNPFSWLFLQFLHENHKKGKWEIEF